MVFHLNSCLWHHNLVPGFPWSGVKVPWAVLGCWKLTHTLPILCTSWGHLVQSILSLDTKYHWGHQLSITNSYSSSTGSLCSDHKKEFWIWADPGSNPRHSLTSCVTLDTLIHVFEPLRNEKCTNCH